MEPYHQHTVVEQQQHHDAHAAEDQPPEAFDDSNNNQVYYTQTQQPVGSTFPAVTPDEATQYQPHALHATGDFQPNDGAIVPLKMYPPAEAAHAEVFTSRELFYNLLQKFHEYMGIHYRTPRIGGQDLDLHTLYREVTAHGGLEQVINNRRWNKVIKPFQFPKSTTSAAFILRKFYSNTLHHFEQVYFFGSTGEPVPPPAPLPSVGGGGGGGGEGTEEKPKRVRKVKQGGVNDPGSRIGQAVTGIVQAKFDFGYLIQVDANGEKLSGILYHVPKTPSAMAFAPPGGAAQGGVLGPNGKLRRKRKRRGEKAASGAPKLNRTGYNFYFKQMKHQLKQEHPDVHDRDISRMIGERWNAMTGDDRLPWQQLAEEDKVRYERDMQMYKITMMAKGAGPADTQQQQLNAEVPKVFEAAPSAEGLPQQQEGEAAQVVKHEAAELLGEQEEAVVPQGEPQEGAAHDEQGQLAGDILPHGSGVQQEGMVPDAEQQDMPPESMMPDGEVVHDVHADQDVAPAQDMEGAPA